MGSTARQQPPPLTQQHWMQAPAANGPQPTVQLQVPLAQWENLDQNLRSQLLPDPSTPSDGSACPAGLDLEAEPTTLVLPAPTELPTIELPACAEKLSNGGFAVI